MRIGKSNIFFMATRSKLIRSRKTKMNLGTRSSSWTSQSTKTTSLVKTLAQKKALAAKNSSKSTSTSQTLLEEIKKNYTSMETAAENAMKHLQKLLNTGESSLWGTEETEMATEPNTDKIQDEITEFVKAYNDMVQSLNEESGTINTMYKKQLHNYVITHKSKLEKIGITENIYGKLELEQEKLQEAETENLKALFQGENSFADKIVDRCEKIEENAKANLTSLNSATYSSLLSSYGSSGSRFDCEA